VVLGAVVALTTHGWSEKTQAPAAKAYHRPAGTGPAVWGPGDLYTYMATGKETNGAYFQFEAVIPAGGGPPPHIHLDKDESFYLIEGSLEMHLGDAIVPAKSGDFVNVPKGTAHNFKNVGDKPAKMLVTFVPAGMEDYFAEVFEPAVDLTRHRRRPPMR
jgi:mannose-6-phosphate isomerase-like protein (cupin superfamily)